MNKHTLTKYEKKLKIESIIFSIIFGLSIGFLSMLLCSVLLYFLKITSLLTLIIVFITTTITTIIIAYKTLYKPSLYHVAKRVDDLGLQERVVTMLELEGKDSAMIQLQRRDAKAKIEKVEAEDIKFKSFKQPLIFLLAIMLISIVGSILLKGEVYAKYQKEYTITFDSVGGTQVESIRLIGGSQIIKPDDPKKAGFDFYYWYELDINDPFDFNTVVEKDYLLYARWEAKSDEDLIIERLIKQLRDIVDRANVGLLLKQELHTYIDDLESVIHREDSLQLKLLKIEQARDYILKRIQQEIDDLNIIKIGEALKQFETTYQLGDAILTRNKTKIDDSIDHLVDSILAIDIKEERVALLLKTADDIEAALELSNEDNPKLRKTLQDLADYLRYLAKEIIEGDIPEEALENEFIEEMEAVKEGIKDALGMSDEEQLKEDIADAFEDAIGELTDPLETDTDKEEKEDEDNEGETGSDETPGETGLPNPEDLIPLIIDGQTKYIDMLEDLKQQAIEKLKDPNLTKQQIDALNKYINNIDLALEGSE